MRVFETAHDHCVLPDLHIVVRLDVLEAAKLTRDLLGYERPVDVRFKNLMVSTTRYLMQETGFRVLYGYTQSDEISLLLHVKDERFERKLRKLFSVLASEASAYASLMVQQRVVFDCRVSQLPNDQAVVDYFLWRQAHAEGLKTSTELPTWRLRGVGVSWAQSATETDALPSYTRFRTEVPGSAVERTLTVYRDYENQWLLRSVSTKDSEVVSDLYFHISGTGYSPTADPPVLWEHEVPSAVLADIRTYWAPYDTITMTQLPNRWLNSYEGLVTNEHLPTGEAYRQWLTGLLSSAS